MEKTTKDIIIRKAEEKDRLRIMELLEMANMHYIPSEEMPEITYDNYFVALVDGEIAGFCGYKILSEDKAKTELMVVDPTFRGLGIGIKLQAKRMQEMFDKGIKTLTTNSDIPATIEWYKKHFGYKKIGELKKIHEFGDPTIYMWTTLQVDLLEWNKNVNKTNARPAVRSDGDKFKTGH
jgi:ribosomal-protein-alanine N-acetyltransferase